MNKENLTAQAQRRRDDHGANERWSSRSPAGFRAYWWRAHADPFARCLSLLGILILSASHFLAQDQPTSALPRQKPAGTEPETRRVEDRILDQLIAHIAASARALQVTTSPSDRVSKSPAVAPGAPPLLSFRYFDGNLRHRFGNLDLVMDDAGH